MLFGSIRSLARRKLVAIVISLALGSIGLGWLTDKAPSSTDDVAKVVAKELGLDALRGLPELATKLNLDELVEPGTRKYERSDFGSWADSDGDCQNTRHEMLIDQAQESPFMSGDNCSVLSGRWMDPYSGQMFSDPKNLDIDHIVPLKWAHEAGASEWSQERKKQFANDPQNLLVVSAKLNRQKGAFGPENWMPPNLAYRCEYVLRFYKLARSYDLLSPDDSITLRKLRTRECRK